MGKNIIMIIKKYNRRYIKIPYAYKEQNELKKPIEEKQKKDWTKYIDLYGKFITILTCATSIIIYLYKNSYKYNCENYYKIPARYFGNTEALANKTNFLILMVFGIIILILCTLSRGNRHKTILDKVKDIVFLTLSGLTLAILDEVFLSDFFRRTEIINNTNVINKIEIIILVIVFLTGYIIVYCGHNKIIVGIVLCINLAVIIIGGVYGVIPSVDDKMKYEFVTIEDKEYVVLSHTENEILIVEYDNTEDGGYRFITNKYWIEDINKGTYRYEKLEHSPKID